MDGKLRVALVGCGGMARLYRHIYTQIDGAELYMLIDCNEEVARNAAEELGVKHYSTNFEDCLCDEVNVVDISTPNFHHKEQTIAAIKAGKSVFLQKPVTVTAEEAHEVYAVQKKYNARVGVYMETRGHRVYNEAKDIIEKGLIGTVTSTRFRKAYITGLDMKKGEWRSDLKKTGGGSFIQLGVHGLDICMWLTNEKITSLTAYSKNNLSPNLGGDDLTVVLTEYENGACGVFESGYSSHGRFTEIYGTDGYIHIEEPDNITLMLNDDYNGDIIKYEKGSGVMRMPTHFTREDLNSPENPYEPHILFIKSILENKETPVDFSEGLYHMEILNSIYKSAEEKKYISI